MWAAVSLLVGASRRGNYQPAWETGKREKGFWGRWEAKLMKPLRVSSLKHT